MAETLVTKQTVKNYIDIENKELAKKMKDKIDNPENWGEFKGELASLVSKYANKPTPENKRLLDNLISNNYVTYGMVGKEGLEEIIRYFGIREIDFQDKPQFNEEANSHNENINEIYEKIGAENPDTIIKNVDEKYQKVHDEKYGIPQYRPRTINEFGEIVEIKIDRKEALKRARERVDSNEDSSISKIIEVGEKKMKEILLKAKEVLTDKAKEVKEVLAEKKKEENQKPEKETKEQDEMEPGE